MSFGNVGKSSMHLSAVESTLLDEAFIFNVLILDWLYSRAGKNWWKTHSLLYGYPSIESETRLNILKFSTSRFQETSVGTAMELMD